MSRSLHGAQAKQGLYGEGSGTLAVCQDSRPPEGATAARTERGRRRSPIPAAASHVHELRFRPRSVARAPGDSDSSSAQSRKPPAKLPISSGDDSKRARQHVQMEGRAMAWVPWPVAPWDWARLWRAVVGKPRIHTPSAVTASLRNGFWSGPGLGHGATTWPERPFLTLAQSS
ncbi:uncharacterized protein LOC143673905 [Tamandua tetradactyla]|uniref:uncharacterized protein LOC143673905 n=1 Tax=Tamandua tetradactyla TaxID=48850 RepID=UPI004053B8DF